MCNFDEVVLGSLSMKSRRDTHVLGLDTYAAALVGPALLLFYVRKFHGQLPFRARVCAVPPLRLGFLGAIANDDER